jgi:hypothetical protein
MTRWIEVTEQRYDEMLGILPPAVYESHGFLVGEPWSHNADGQPTFAAFLRYRYCGYGNVRYYESCTPMTIQEFRKLPPYEAELEIVSDCAEKHYETLLEAT